MRSIAQRLNRECPPPDVWFRVRTHGRARQTDLPVLGDQRTQLVAGLPLDLVLLDAVEHLLVRIEADAVRRTRLGTLATDLAEVVDAQVDGLIRLQRKVCQDGVAQVDARAKLLGNDQSIAAQLTNTTGERGSLWIHFAAQGGVTKLANVKLQRGQYQHRLHERRVVRGVADVVAVRLSKLVVPGNRSDDNVRILAAQLRRGFGRARFTFDHEAGVAQRAARVQQRRMRAPNADDIRAEIAANILDVARHGGRIGDFCFRRIDPTGGCAAQDVCEDVALIAAAIRV